MELVNKANHVNDGSGRQEGVFQQILPSVELAGGRIGEKSALVTEDSSYILCI